MHICPYKAQHAWTNHHYRRQLAMALQKAGKLPQIEIIYSAETMPQPSHLEFSPWSLWNPLNLSHLCHVPKEWDISFNKPRRMTNDFDYSKVRNATTLDAENSADYIYWRPPSYKPCKRSWHLTQDPKRRPTPLSHSYRICRSTIFQPVSSLKVWWVLHSRLCFQSQ